MAKSSRGGSSSFTGELIHYHPVRLRINGSGTFRQTLSSLDDVKTSTLPNLTMAASTDIEPTVLSSFISQRAALKGEVINIDEWFLISKITIFVRPVAASVPQ